MNLILTGFFGFVIALIILTSAYFVVGIWFRGFDE